MYIIGFDIPSITLFTTVMSISLKSIDILFLLLLTISLVHVPSTAFRNIDLGFLSIELSLTSSVFTSRTNVLEKSQIPRFFIYVLPPDVVNMSSLCTAKFSVLTQVLL